MRVVELQSNGWNTISDIWIVVEGKFVLIEEVNEKPEFFFK
jgi:hypothetical protein